MTPDRPAEVEAHLLTVDTLALADGRYRVVATCTCLNWARSANVSAAPVAEVGHLMIADQHDEHLARVATGAAIIEDRPPWLPPLGDVA